MREAGLWSAGLGLLAFLFGGFLWWREGPAMVLEFYSGYLIELSLSVDNLFVFLLIFQYFRVPPDLQPRVLKWGIFGAIVMRGITIAPDRKSTRLNSSHGYTSYAVFCLKKKTKKQCRNIPHEPAAPATTTSDVD